MLGKLLKHEFKATARLFVPLYITIVIFSLINRFIIPIYDMSGNAPTIYKIVVIIAMFAYITSMIGLVIMTLVVMIQRFYKSLLGDEGYLMFTLPVQPWMHIVSKLAISMLWTVVSTFVAIGSILVTFSKYIFVPEFYKEWNMMLGQLKEAMGSYGAIVGLESIVMILLSVASAILLIYAAIALGHLFNKHKLLMSFGMYIGLRMISQMLMLPFVFIFSFNAASVPETGSMPIGSINGFLLVIILYFCIITAGYYLLTNYILKKKLNLE